MGLSATPKPEPLSAYLRRMNASPGAEGKAIWPQLVSSVRRLEAIEAAAQAVCENEGPSLAQRADFWDAIDLLKEALDA